MNDHKLALTVNVARVLVIVLVPMSIAAGLSLGAPSAQADLLHSTSGSITGRLCVGIDCITSESFSGIDGTLRLKETVVRIDFVDTSSTTFPNNEWRILINEDGTTGFTKNFFAAADMTAEYIPLAVETGAGANALYVDAAGNVGLGIENPGRKINALGGDTPCLRLKKDTTGGFSAQVWDIPGNDINFFIRDVSAADDVLPMRIMVGFQISNLVPFGTGKVRISWHGNIAFMCDNRRISNPLAMLHLYTRNNPLNLARYEVSDRLGIAF